MKSSADPADKVSFISPPPRPIDKTDYVEHMYYFLEPVLLDPFISIQVTKERVLSSFDR